MFSVIILSLVEGGESQNREIGLNFNLKVLSVFLVHRWTSILTMKRIYQTVSENEKVLACHQYLRNNIGPP